MNKPKWSEVPSWCKWISIDYDGRWMWWSRKPITKGEEWLCNNGYGETAGFSSSHENPGFKKTLEKRP